jgi:hypothetical protein
MKWTKFKAEFDEAVYEEQCGMIEMVLELDAIKEEVGNVRKQYTKFND